MLEMGIGRSIHVLRSRWAPGDTHHVTSWMHVTPALRLRSCAYWQVAVKCLGLLSYKLKIILNYKYALLWLVNNNLQSRIAPMEKELLASHLPCVVWTPLQYEMNACLSDILVALEFLCFPGTLLFFEFLTNRIIPLAGWGREKAEMNKILISHRCRFSKFNIVF